MLQRPVAEAASRRPGRTGKTQLKLFNAAMEIMTQKGLSTPLLKRWRLGRVFLREPYITISVLRRLWWISWFSTARSCC